MIANPKHGYTGTEDSIEIYQGKCFHPETNAEIDCTILVCDRIVKENPVGAASPAGNRYNRTLEFRPADVLFTDTASKAMADYGFCTECGFDDNWDLSGEIGYAYHPIDLPISAES